jgi:hypothetical protein
MSNGTNFLAVWRPGNGAQYWSTGLNYDDFKAKDLEHFKQGLRLVSLRVDAGRFTGIWHPGTGAQWWSTGLSVVDFKAKDKEHFGQGLRLVDIEVHDGAYSGVWRPGSGAQWWSTNLDYAAFKAKDKEHFDAGLRLACVRVQSNGQFTGVWHPGSGTQWWSTGLSSAEFKAKDKEHFDQGLRLVDIEFHNGSYTAVWRPGSGEQRWSAGNDFEMFSGWDKSRFDGGLRLLKVIPYGGACDIAYLNQVVIPTGEYNYGITSTAQHCKGVSGSCGAPAAGAVVAYRWPCLTFDGSKRFARMSALSFASVPLFTLPFSDHAVKELGPWLYSPGHWHCAIDYQRGDKTSFPVLAAAAGKVIFNGWDWWSGNTIVISHDANGVSDAFRTIYMHLRNGPKHDADLCWNVTVPSLSGVAQTQYKSYLAKTGCPQNGVYTANPDFWGTDADKIDAGIVGKQVPAGALIAHAGCTGPGGCGCTDSTTANWKWSGSANNHLHIFFSRRDPTDNEWYLVDPYGIYASGGGYPGMNNAITTPCARYPILWKGAKSQYP